MKGYFGLRNCYTFRYMTAGTIPPEMGNMKAIETLIIHTNKYNGSLPSELSYLTNITAMYLFSNKFTGSVPPDFSRLKNLQVFDISDNQITGIIPDGIYNTSLTQFKFANNKIRGSLPDEAFGNLINLVDFNGNENMLTGSLPSSITRCSLLGSFYVQQNFLTGDCNAFDGPTFSRLQSIDISNNNLQGNFPNGIFSSPNLKFLYADNNCWSGLIDESICVSEGLEVLSLDAMNAGSFCRFSEFSISITSCKYWFSAIYIPSFPF